MQFANPCFITNVSRHRFSCQDIISESIDQAPPLFHRFHRCFTLHTPPWVFGAGNVLLDKFLHEVSTCLIWVLRFRASYKLEILCSIRYCCKQISQGPGGGRRKKLVKTLLMIGFFTGCDYRTHWNQQSQSLLESGREPVLATTRACM